MKKLKTYLDEPPVFICGFPSGGTDLLRTVMNAHPEIYLNGEMPFLYYLPKYQFKNTTDLTDPKNYNRLIELLRKFDVWNTVGNLNYEFKEEELKNLNLNRALRTLFNNTNKKIWGNKTPQNSENIHNLLKLFPNAKFILILRDVRDVCLSWRRKWGKNEYLCSHRWSERMGKTLKVVQQLPKEQVLIVKFEELLADTELTTKEIAKFLNIEWSEKMLEHHLHTKKVIDGKINYGKSIVPGNKEKWKKYLSKKEVKEIEMISYNTMLLAGYNPCRATKQTTIGIYNYLYGYCQDLYAMFFVGNRFSKKADLKDKFGSFFFEIKKRVQ